MNEIISDTDTPTIPITPTSNIEIDGVSYDAATLTVPDRKMFRDAWAITGSVIEIDLPAAIKVAIEAVRTEHAARLLQFTGNATVEERDTWTIQQRMAETYKASLSDTVDTEAQAFLVGLLTDTEKAAIDAAGEDRATFMADKIIVKVKQTNTLIMMAGRMKRTAEEAIEAVSSIEELYSTLEYLKAEEAATQAAFLAAIST